jgi:mono/diheme cytochrome c family protein
MKKRGLLFAMFAATALVATAQEKVVEVKTVPIKRTNPASGGEMYAAYCAACHGATAQGNGPAAPAFKKPPTDLTLLARNNKGKYPAEHVYVVLSLGTHVTAHGNTQMPIWKPLLDSLNASPASSDSVTVLRLNNLVDNIGSIQAK